MPAPRSAAVTLLAAVTVLGVSLPAAVPSLREAAAARRAALLTRVPAGLVVVQSVDRSQPTLYEFMVPDTENHDFIFLTGLDGPQHAGSTLVLNPHGETHREILYTTADPAAIRRQTGLTHVFPREKFLEDLSSALTDYRNLRITQLRFKPAASDLSRGLSAGSATEKVVYLNYPRFTNLNEPPNPRLQLAARLREASPEIELRHAEELLDPLRMIHDAYGQAQLRRAIQVTGRGLMEAMRAVRPGHTTRHVSEVIDFVYRLNGAGLGFPTGVFVGPIAPVHYATTQEEEADRAGAGTPIPDGALVHIDTGAEVNHYSADIQRVVPANGRFTAEQRKFYDTVAAVQKAVIAQVRPGATWRGLHDLAVRMLREAGGLDKTYTYGIGHFIGMEVHDHGDYVGPLQPGMVLAIEQGAILDGTRVAFEDDVLVTADGHEWLSRFIPIDADEVERLRAEPPLFDPLRLIVKEP